MQFTTASNTLCTAALTLTKGGQALIVLLIMLPLGSVSATERLAQVEDESLPEITLLSTMVANYLGAGEWGFSALLEFPQTAWLFDTGFKADTVKNNAARLGKDLSKVESVILSHFHTDHTGGLLTLRRTLRTQNPNAFSTVYVAPGFFLQRYSKGGVKTYSLPNPYFTESFETPTEFRAAAEGLGMRFVVVEEPLQILPGVVLTGAIDRVHDEQNVGPGFFLKSPRGDLVADTVPESQVLGVNTRRGWVLISGCGHAGIVNAAEQLRRIKPQAVYLAMGGFHLFQANDAVIDWTAAELARFGVQKLVGAHCTGAYATQRIADHLDLSRDAVSIGAIGMRVDSDLNIVPSSIE